MSGPPSRSSTPTTSPASNRLSEPARAGAKGSLPRGLLWLAVGAAAGVFALYLLVVRTHWGQDLDERTLLGSDVISSLRAAQADRFLRIVSIGTIGLAMVLVAVVAFLRGRPRLALVAAGSIVCAVLCTEVLKLFILERPDLVETTLNGGDNSYPSGHTTVGMAVCIAAMLVVPARLRTATAIGAGAVGATFGVAVVAASWHRPSDAVGAYLVCLAVGALAALLIQVHPDAVGVPRGERRTLGSRSFGLTEAALLGLALALVGIFGVAALSARGIPLFSASAGFLIASAMLVLLAFATTGLLASAMAAAEAED